MRPIIACWLFIFFHQTLAMERHAEDKFTKLRFGDSPQRFYDAPISERPPIEPETEIVWASDVIHVTNVKFDAGRPCSCSESTDEWSKWSRCTSSAGECYRATQTRQRDCISGCRRVEVRYCLHEESCSGTWGPWMIMNNTCTTCRSSRKRELIRFCVSKSSGVGPHCKGSEGRTYQVKQEDCQENCDYLAAKSDKETPIVPFGSRRRNSDHGLDGKSTLIIILLAVLAGVLLVALIFVSVVLASARKRQRTGRSRRGMSRDLRSISESNISATSYLSVADRESKASGRPSLYQRHKAGGSGRSLVSPLNHIATVSMLGNGSVSVRGPMQHTDSLMLARKQISKRSSKGSVRSINKLMKERFRLDHRSTTEESEDGLFIGSLNLREDGEVILTHSGKRENIPKRRATVGAGDFKNNDIQEKYFSGGMRKESSKELHTTSASDQESTEEREADKPSKVGSRSRLSSGSSSSMEQGDEYDGSRKRLSVDDIRKIFESRVSDQEHSPRNYSKTTADIPHFGAVNENISRFEQASRTVHHSLDRERGGSGRGVRRSTTMVVSSRVAKLDPPTSASNGDISSVGTTDHNKLIVTPEDANVEKHNVSAPAALTPLPSNEAKIQTSEKALQQNGVTSPPGKNTGPDPDPTAAKPRQRTFLFSPQAYNSLQRTSNTQPRTSTPQQPGKASFKLDMDALMKSTTASNKPKGGRHVNGNGLIPENAENIRPRSFHDGSANGIVVPPPRGALKSYDSDTYADVWDAKVKSPEQDVTDNVYADVWQSDAVSMTSRTSICLDDDDDYSEVYDSLNPSRHRSATAPPKSSKHRLVHGSMSAGSPALVRPQRPPPPFTKRRLSRDSSTGSDGSGSLRAKAASVNATKRRSAEILLNATRPEVEEDPIYCVI